MRYGWGSDAPKLRELVSYKAVIEVPTATGFWTAWVTIPADAARETRRGTPGYGYQPTLAEIRDALVGQVVDVAATMKRSDRDASFAFGSRPTMVVCGPSAGANWPVPSPRNRKEARAIVGSEFTLEVEAIVGVVSAMIGLASLVLAEREAA